MLVHDKGAFLFPMAWSFSPYFLMELYSMVFPDRGGSAWEDMGLVPPPALGKRRQRRA